MECIIFNSPIYIESSDKSKVNEDYLPPIGEGYIATCLKESNIDVRLIDCVYECLGIKEILAIINREKPKYIGINIFTINMHIVKEIVEKTEIKTTYIIGGHTTKFIYKDLLNWKTKNSMYIIIGEGEYIVKAIINDEIKEKAFMEKDNKKVYFINKNSIYFPKEISNMNLDRSFFVNREIKNRYGDKEVAIITSRGCIYNCAFCGGARSLNKEIVPRERNESSIIKEIDDIISKTPRISSIRILDDLFLKDRQNILKAIKIFNNYPNISWRAMAHIRSFNNSSDLLIKLKDSGCKELFIGIESGSDRIRKSINKVGSTDEVLKSIHSILEVGINVKGYFIYGFPEEEVIDLRATYDLAKKIKSISLSLSGVFRCSVFQFRPYHGTELYNRIIKKHINIKECSLNKDISVFEGRKQFNYQSGNYSNCTSEEINGFIIKTLNLNNGEKDDKNY